MATQDFDSTLRITTLPAPTPARVLHLAGELDYDSLHQLRGALAAAFQDRPPLLVLDLAELDSCDSSGLSELITASRNQHGIPIVLAAPTPRVQGLFDLTGVNQILAVTASVPAAIEQHLLGGTTHSENSTENSHRP
ncbi:STAS domain-containing protein [Kitasatospora phosalacinea]|uniref:STAS domain-containing protein n=1 Tax=Kitasatospora phosalacinea TaxID=2065 RepID=UPI00255476ED|nr:STAS domain-containing protein [Kitasatospora phosalacinea]